MNGYYIFYGLYFIVPLLITIIILRSLAHGSFKKTLCMISLIFSIVMAVYGISLILQGPELSGHIMLSAAALLFALMALAWPQDPYKRARETETQAQDETTQNSSSV